jgi:hypothetical protein
MKFDPTQLNKLIDQVSDDVVTMLAKADEAEKATLAKANPGEEAPGEETPSGSSAEGSPEGSPDAGGEAPEATPPAGEPDGDEGAPPEAAPQEGAPGDEQTQNPAEDASAGPEALVAEYSKLPIEELKMHVMASHAALMQAIGGQPGAEGGAPAGAPGAEGAPQGQPEAPAPAPEGVSPEGSQPVGTEEPPMGKKEFSSEGNGGKIVKSELETRLAQLEKSNKDLETKLGEATDGLRRFVEKSGNQALRKSIANVSFTGKPGEAEGKKAVTLSKSEATKKLNVLTADREAMGKLQKSDREKITQYTLGTIPQSEISHLLK